MLLQSSFLQNRNVSLSSAVPSFRPPVHKPPSSVNFQKVSVTCSISQVHSYGTLDYERRTVVKWNAIYKKISLNANPELDTASVLNQWEKDDSKLTKWELCRLVKELRKYKKYKQALEVYEWMKNREERFRLTVSDSAIQLDLIAKARGIPSAEDFFIKLPDSSRDGKIYGALLNAYVRTKMREKAESLIDRMRDEGYAVHCLPFNVMMTLYMNLMEYDKVESMVMEMKKKKIRLDVYSYNIWLSSCGSQGSLEKMEEVYDQMKRDKTINSNWTTYSTLATMYIKMGHIEKAEDCLRKVEARITGRDRVPYHYLLSLYGNVGNKEQLYRVWQIYKAVFPTIPNLGYHAIISSLVRIGDIVGAEKIYGEWLEVKTSYDPRMANLLINWYVKNGDLDKAETFFEQMMEVGGKPNSNTWEILAEGHIGERRISEALSCFKKAFASDKSSKSWRPKPAHVTSFFELCDEDGDFGSKEALVELFRRSRHLKDKAYASLIGLTDEAAIDDELLLIEKEEREILSRNYENERDGSEMLLNELQ